MKKKRSLRILMSRMKGRSTGLLGLLLLIAVLLVACGGGTGSEDAAGTATADAAANGAETTEPVTLIVSAAASLRDSLESLTPQFEQENPGITVTYNYGASGSLQKQIEQGAPADVFLSAGQKQMDALIESGHIEAEQSLNLLKNSLVVIVPADAKVVPESLNLLEDADTGIGMIAVGEPEVVPAGMYAKESLEHEQLWDKLYSKMVFTKDVTQVLTYIESGNADAGFVYLSDAKSSTKVKTAFAIDDSYHRPIVYPAGMVAETKHREAAQAFMQFIRGTAASDIFTEHGFTVAE
ncbi:molybdate ABC transporter substrate-binding protein [Paenibacillus aceti]|uniref:molybdate ABC transporter substrate-binding protein n=1 Tax=Paenibacillus aceti TaxID=1820010 RepID=UPI000EA3A62C|nr:molybdate ABC transporter substrate-binding protein [Paenibacillus aceti]